ncbi:MAG: WYL domain-containing protein [Nitrosomonas sp.]|nr:WYL domain-containing protein [Nitrosomonas sp.]
MEIQRDTQRERLFYIDFLAFFTGQVTRKDLVVRFGISEPAATKDLSLYAELAPNMLSYDLRQRCYVYGSGAPRFPHSVDQALYSLCGERPIAIDSGHAKRLPGSVQISIKRKIPVEVVAAITRAMYRHQKVVADYMSLNSGKAERTLSPMAVVHDGLRWHIRCYDHNHNEFRDYNLARFNAVNESGVSEVTLDDDKAWSTEVTIKLVPHPKIMRPETVRLDYDIEGEAKLVVLRSCLVPYFLRHWHIDTTPNATKNPNEQQLFLQNRQELWEQGIAAWAFDNDVPTL